MRVKKKKENWKKKLISKNVEEMWKKNKLNLWETKMERIKSIDKSLQKNNMKRIERNVEKIIKGIREG